MKYATVFATMFLAACGESLTYSEVTELQNKCTKLGGNPVYRSYGTVGEGKVSDVDCEINGITFTQGKY